MYVLTMRDQETMVYVRYNILVVRWSVYFKNRTFWWYQYEYKIEKPCVLQRNIPYFLTWDEINSRKTFPSLSLSSNFWYQNNWQYCFAQAIASFFGIFACFAFSNLYATLVCVACSQCEMLRADLLNIRQTHVITERVSEDDSGQQDSEQQTHTTEQVFQHMRKQLNECIRHHQDINRYEHMSSILFCISFILRQKKT